MSQAAAAIPQVWRRYLSGPKLFGSALIFVTIVPYFAWLYANLVGPGHYMARELRMFAQLFIAIGILHVPTTIYLYFDPAIRKLTREHPLGMAIIPIAWIILLPLAIIGLWNIATPASMSTLIVLLTLFVAWQAWHFGMQSYGVHCFVSMTSQRPKRDLFQVKCEKYCIMLGTISGMLAVYHAIGQTAFIKNFPMVDYGWIDAWGNAAFTLGKVICFSTVAFAIGYFIAYRKSFTIGTALMFFVGVCFFLPDYFPRISPNRSAFSLNSGSNFFIIHGIQYIVFLAAHALCASCYNFSSFREEGQLASQPRRLASMLLFVLAPLAAFAIALKAGALFTDMQFNARWFTSAMRSFDIDMGTRNILIGFALVQGFTAAHFVVDMQVWRLSRPKQREWIFTRYKSVLPGFK